MISIWLKTWVYFGLSGFNNRTLWFDDISLIKKPNYTVKFKIFMSTSIIQTTFSTRDWRTVCCGSSPDLTNKIRVWDSASLPGAVRVQGVEHCVLDGRVEHSQLRVNHSQVLTQQSEDCWTQCPHLERNTDRTGISFGSYHHQHLQTFYSVFTL